MIEAELAAVRPDAARRPAARRAPPHGRAQQGRRARGPRAGRDGHARPRGPRAARSSTSPPSPATGCKRADLRHGRPRRGRTARTSEVVEPHPRSCCAPRPSTTPASRSRARRPDGEVFRRAGAARRAGSARPTSPTTRPSATSPTGWPRSASRRRCSRPVRCRARGRHRPEGRRVVFDWEPTMSAGAELLPASRHRPAPRGEPPAHPRAEARRLRRPAGGQDCRRATSWPPSARPATGPPQQGTRTPTNERGAAARRHRPCAARGRQGGLVVADRRDGGGLDEERLDALVDVLAERRLRRA